MRGSRSVGALGEEIASKFLSKQGFTILERNYRKHFVGEIDIVAKKDAVIHFVEVKTFSREMSEYAPEQNVHYRKLQKVIRTSQHFMLEKRLIGQAFQVDVLAIVLNKSTRLASCKLIENVS